MSVYQKDSPSWQLQRLQQQSGEWWEGLLAQFRLKFPDIPVSDQFLSLSWDMIRSILIISLIILLTRLIWRFRYLIAPYWKQWLIKSENQPKFPKNVSLSEWVTRSNRARQEGNYYQACRCLYFAMLQHLDETGILPQQSSRTDEEYRFLLLKLADRQPYDRLLAIHQQLCFSDRVATADLLAECQQAYREIAGIYQDSRLD